MFAPFGEVRAGALSELTDFGYTGQHVDASTDGLMYYGARYYLPELRRFISADSVVPGAGNPQALNRYAYALNNPISFLDPTGHYSCPADMGPEECGASTVSSSRFQATTGGGGSSGTPQVSIPTIHPAETPSPGPPAQSGGSGSNEGGGGGGGGRGSGGRCRGCGRTGGRGGNRSDGGQQTISGSSPRVAEEFAAMTMTSRLSWLDTYQQELSAVAPGLGDWFNGIHGFVAALQDTSFGANPYLSWGDAAVLQQLQNGYLLSQGMPIACSSSGSFTDCFQSANAWAYFISEFQSGTRGGQLISIYGYAEGQGAHYGVDLAYAVNGRSASSLSSEAEFRTLLASADVYRDGQMFPITKGIPLFHPTSDTVAYGGILAFEGALHSIGAKFP